MPKGVKMEKYRPKIHFSAEDYIINDPNGLVYYKGEYHLFHQYNINEQIYWGHAVSKDMIGFGGSPRASINLALAARTYAFIKRRGYVIPEDVRAVAHDVLRHRIGLTYEAEASNVTSDEIVSKILNKVEVP